MSPRVVALTFLIGCTPTGDKFDTDMDTAAEIVVGCPDGGSTWTGDPLYHFEEHNWTCVSPRIAPDFDVDLDSFDSQGYSTTGVEQEITDVFALWNGVGADISVAIGSTNLTGLEADGQDGANVIFMDPGNEVGDTGSGDVLAEALSWPSSGGSAENCDITIFDEGDDGSTQHFVFNGLAIINEFDATWLILHESGHCLGLGHNDITSGLFKQSVMFSGLGAGENFVAMFALDEEGLLFLYGVP